MKKISRIVTVIAALACVLMMSGCGIKDAITQTYDQWYKYNGTLDIPLGQDEESADTIGTLENAEFYIYFNEDEGLTVAVQTTKEENVSVLGGLVQYPMETIFGSVKNFDTSKFGATSWSGLMILGNFKKSSEPAVVSGGAGVVKLENILENGIQWKKVLKRKLIERVLDATD